jgi:xylulokinase
VADPAGPNLLGIDVGTTAVKATVVDERGDVLASASVPYPTDFVRPSWVEQDPEDWWRAAVAALARIAMETGAAVLDRVGGVAVSAQAPTLVALDSGGRPVRPALIWMDRRAEAETAAISALVGADRLAQITGNRPDPFYVAPKIRWLRDHEPDAFARARWFVQINGYLVLRLTGTVTMDEQHASILGVRDLTTGDWDPGILDAIGADPSRFPSIVAATAVVGEVTRDAAAATGLRVGTPVVAGTVDSAAAALEAGVVDPGEAAEMTGTSTVVVLPVDGLRPQPEFITMASVVPGRWVHLAAMVATGASLQWIKDMAGEHGDTGELAARAAATEPGGLVFLPYMMGERSPIWDSAARGAFIGLTLGTRTEDLVRAVLEGTAFALRHNLEVAEGRGLAPRLLRSIGGPAGSDAWCQIKADVTGLPVARMSAATGASFGDAIIAAVGVGRGDLVGLVRERARVDRQFVPDPQKAARYDDLYRVYRSSYDHLRTDLTALAATTNIPEPR